MFTGLIYVLTYICMPVSSAAAGVFHGLKTVYSREQ